MADHEMTDLGRSSPSLDELVARSEASMAHAWMVRTFVKHSPEVEQFPELMEIVRTVFDMARALETKVADPPAYLHMLRKKIGKLRKAADQFRHDAPLVSDHTNFKQSVVSLDACVRDLDEIVGTAAAVTPGTPPPIPSAATVLEPGSHTADSSLDVVVDVQEDQME